jgi:TRAP-type mannitol/chloroaromatic compound transport system permease large subunit
MMGIFLFAVLLGFPIAFTLMAMGIGLVITLITMLP